MVAQCKEPTCNLPVLSKATNTLTVSAGISLNFLAEPLAKDLKKGFVV